MLYSYHVTVLWGNILDSFRVLLMAKSVSVPGILKKKKKLLTVLMFLKEQASRFSLFAPL